MKTHMSDRIESNSRFPFGLCLRWRSEPEHTGEFAAFLAGQRWGREQGCGEFASDAQPDNATSLLAHRAVGFEDAGVVQCFCKGL
jgi:aminoglycoside 6'-N-acetyltransferase I